MASRLADVTFPLFGSGSTPTVTDSLPLRLVSLSGTTLDARWCGDDWSSPEWRFYFNLDDGAEAVVGRRVTALRAGELYAIPAWLRWSARCHGLVRHGNALVDLPSLPRDRVIATCTGVLHLAAADQPLALAWQEVVSALARTSQIDPVMVAQAHAAVWSAVAAVFQRLGPATQRLLPIAPPTPLAELIAWVERHLDRPLTLAVLAHQAGCSPAELVRRFRRTLGTAPARWLRERRVAVAAGLLRDTDLAIDAIAVRCGLGERSHFSRVFARLCGCGPAAFRQRG